MKKTLLLSAAFVLVSCAPAQQGAPAGAPGPSASTQPSGSQPAHSDAQSLIPADGVLDMSTFTRLSSGLMYRDAVIGTGATAVNLRDVEVHYTGALSTGMVFDSSRERGTPIKFQLGQGRVIKGWDQGVRGMREGGRRLLVIPPDLAYGPRGSGDRIPPNATLIFDVALISVR